METTPKDPTQNQKIDLISGIKNIHSGLKFLTKILRCPVRPKITYVKVIVHRVFSPLLK